MAFPKDCDFLCVLDWDEELYQKAKLWAQGRKRAAFVSEQLRRSSSPNIKIYHLESPIQNQAILKKIAWSSVFQKVHVVGDRSVETLKLAAELILSEASDFWIQAFRNARANHTAYRRGMDLKGAFQKIPAVIVGAGPSLAQYGHLLKELKKSALLFAGGAALNIIDIEPDFAASIDVAAPIQKSGAPFCYQSRMSSENFSLIQGEKILFPDSSCPGINWIYKEEMFNGGWTVGNFLTAAAVHFGCSPIIFIGMDFCYEKGKKYASGGSGENLIEVDGFLTQRDFFLAARWTEEFAKDKEFFKIGDGLLNLPKRELFSFPKKEVQVLEAIQRVDLKEDARWNEWDASIAECKKNLESMNGEVVYQMLLEPLWQIWKTIFEREVELDPTQNIEHHKMAFFQKVLEEHG